MSCQIKNNTNLDLTDLQSHLDGMYDHFNQKLGFQKPPVIVFDSDPSNQANVLGKTAYYDPQSFEVHIFIDGRHPKDMLRSIAHELIHHQQNLEGRLDVGGYNGPGYYLKNDKMKEIEQEAMLEGNAILREYEDNFKNTETENMSLKEWKNLTNLIVAHIREMTMLAKVKSATSANLKNASVTKLMRERLQRLTKMHFKW